MRPLATVRLGRTGRIWHTAPFLVPGRDRNRFFERPGDVRSERDGCARIFGYQILGTLSEVIDQVELGFESGTDAATKRGVRTAMLSHSIEQTETLAHTFGDPWVISIVHGGMFHYPSQHSRKTVRQKQVGREVNSPRVTFSRKDISDVFEMIRQFGRNTQQQVGQGGFKNGTRVRNSDSPQIYHDSSD